MTCDGYNPIVSYGESLFFKMIMCVNDSIGIMREEQLWMKLMPIVKDEKGSCSFLKIENLRLKISENNKEDVGLHEMLDLLT